MQKHTPGAFREVPVTISGTSAHRVSGPFLPRCARIEYLTPGLRGLINEAPGSGLCGQ